MKKIFFILLVFHFSLTIGNAQWVQKSAGMGANVKVWSIAVNGINIFAGTDAGVYLSANNGENWSQTSFNSQPGNVLLIDGLNIFVGTSGGVFRSTNNGLNWTKLASINGSVWALAVYGSYIFAGTNFQLGVYRSTDYGMNWTQTTLNNAEISSLAVIGNNLIAGDWGSSSVFRSTDNGNNWMQIPVGGTAVDVVLSLAVLGNNIFAGTDNAGVFRSTNYGVNWINIGLNAKGISSLTVKDNNIFAGDFFNAEVYLSTNFGTNWKLKNNGLGSQNSVLSLATTAQYIFAGTDSSVWRREYAEIIDVKKISEMVPSAYSLSQNYPNPFNPNTKIKFNIASALSSPHALSGEHFVSLKVYNLLGQEITTLINEKIKPGEYEVTFDGSNLPGGVYFYKLTAGDFSETKKMLMIK